MYANVFVYAALYVYAHMPTAACKVFTVELRLCYKLTHVSKMLFSSAWYIRFATSFMLVSYMRMMR